MSAGRGPDMRELALTGETRALLALYALEEQAARLFDELIDAQAKVAEQGEEPRRPKLSILGPSWQARRGEAFWDRPPPDPTPAAIARR